MKPAKSAGTKEQQQITKLINAKNETRAILQLSAKHQRPLHVVQQKDEA